MPVPNKITKSKTNRITIKNPCRTNAAIKFKDRKRGIECDLETGIWETNKRAYEQMPLLQDSGRDFNASEENKDKEKIFHISGRFLPDPLYKKLGKFTTPTTPTTYLYIISKTIEGKTYFKVGEGGKGSAKGTGRLGDAQTYLIPGLEDAGYKVHFVFFFRKNLHHNSIHIGQHIEHNIHKIMRYYFKPINISYANDEPSEWYLLQNDKEQAFFLGFVFDIVGCYDHEKTKPLEIWKYNSKSQQQKSKVKMPPSTEIIQRMKLNDTYKEIESKLTEFNLRKKQRALGLIIDKNDATQYAEQLPIVKRFFGFSLREIMRKNQYSVTFDNNEFNLTNFTTHSTYERNKYSKYYAVLVPSNTNTMDKSENYFKSKNIEIQSFKDNINDSSHILLRMKDFLKLYRENYIDDKWELQPIYNFYFSPDYDKNIVEVPATMEQIPSWFSNTTVQLYWAKKMANDREWKYHEDYALDEDGEDGAQKKSWESFGYDEEDGVRLKRRQLDTNNQPIENTQEEVNVLRIMKILNVYKPEKINKRELKQNYSVLKSIKVKSENGINSEYKQGNIVEIRDDYFLWYDKYGEPDGLPHLEWRKYKIEMVYRNMRYDEEFMNPWMDVRLHDNSDDTIQAKYELVANEYMEGKIRKIGHEEAVRPVFEKGQIIHVLKSKTKHLFENKSWHQHEHYVMIDSIDKRAGEYIIRMFAPFANTERIPIEVLQLHVSIGEITKKDSEKLENYKNDLLFKIMPIDIVEDHKPKGATSHADLIREGRRNPQYKILFENAAAGDMGIDDMQSAKSVEKNAPGKVAGYWRTLKRGPPKRSRIGRVTRKKQVVKSKLYEFETFDDNMARAKQNWADHHNNNLKNMRNQKSAYEYPVYKPSGTLTPFRVGDIFITGGRNPKKGFIVNFFYNENEKKMTYGVFFSKNDNEAVGNEYPEYTDNELLELLREGNTVEFLKNLDQPKVFGKMIRRFESMI